MEIKTEFLNAYTNDIDRLFSHSNSVATCPLFGRTVLDLRVLSSVLSLIGRIGEKSSFLQTKKKMLLFYSESFVKMTEIECVHLLLKHKFVLKSIMSCSEFYDFVKNNKPLLEALLSSNIIIRTIITVVFLR